MMSENHGLPSGQRPGYPEEIDVRELVSVLWKGKLWIIGVTFIAAVISVVLALRLTDIYRAEVLLATDEAISGAGGLQGLASQYGGLASLAGFSLPPALSNQKSLGIAKLRSRQFINGFMDRRNVIPDLIAAESYNTETRELSYDPTIYDPETEVWAVDFEQPSSQAAFMMFESRLEVIEDPATGFVTVSLTHLSPMVAYEWVTWLIDDLNRELMLEAVEEAQQSIDYLTEQVENTQVVALEQVFYSLIEEQTKTIMLANSRPEYLFEIIDPAIAPEIKFLPNRALFCVIGTLIGGILSVLWVFFLHYLYRARR